MSPQSVHITSFKLLAETAQSISSTRGNNAKIKLFVDYLSELESDKDVELATQFLSEGAFSSVSGKRASVGHRTIATLAADFCEIDYEKVFKPSKTASGSSSETIQRLFENIPEARAKWKGENLTLQEINEVFESLYITSKRDAKQQILLDTWKIMTPLEVKYFIRILGQGSLRIGFETKSVENAIAKTYSKELETVRYARMISGSIGKTAIMAKNDTLDEAAFKMFSPIAFMLASPIESRAVTNLSEYIAEEKFDGMRCQAHISDGRIELFSRDLNEITSSFPEIIEFFSGKQLPDLVLDGEICVFKDNTILPFQLLQKRMGVKKPSKKLLTEFPVLFISYDVLYKDEDPLFDDSLSVRRDKLEKISNKYSIPITSQMKIANQDDVEELFQRALDHGNEGLMLKRKDSVYEYGQRRKSWLKVKKPSGSLDTVMLYAHAGSGKRGGTYSDFTLGISVKDDDRYEEEFIPIGKAYGGYSDEELKKMNALIKDITLERFGPTLLLKPNLVIELEFEDIQINKRTKAKYTLRFPRFKAIRWDLSPSDADTLRDVERMYQQKIDNERLRQGKNPSFIF
ncbi:MAG: ATP-dependent DNA ligase [Balneola sp.]|nr:ATP-dependent DNA ligase [Balneola sp.]MBO6650887.1 ATP-dependent DNA ligase [Balneola sp.]MBO6711828.1 ATP-dependent DNA ligase [Balneola sp.]MBO6800023.1 ATP-dependent DNA ligase [Balneola sp.]MBO6871596.1 ATP-dependent DNA ligase [Balneola sp.]